MDKFGDFIGHQTWLAPVENVLSAVANTTFNKLMPYRRCAISCTAPDLGTRCTLC
ncbi:MAG: hypothetical protein H0T11_06660 [Chthoniobacterales bacterium]|nr:hypothetical protein [Chthoniobacterales bacterium]